MIEPRRSRRAPRQVMHCFSNPLAAALNALGAGLLTSPTRSARVSRPRRQRTAAPPSSLLDTLERPPVRDGALRPNALQGRKPPVRPAEGCRRLEKPGLAGLANSAARCLTRPMGGPATTQKGRCHASVTVQALSSRLPLGIAPGVAPLPLGLSVLSGELRRTDQLAQISGLRGSCGGTSAAARRRTSLTPQSAQARTGIIQPGRSSGQRRNG